MDHCQFHSQAELEKTHMCILKQEQTSVKSPAKPVNKNDVLGVGRREERDPEIKCTKRRFNAPRN